jgi:hypothetical protein
MEAQVPNGLAVLVLFTLVAAAGVEMLQLAPAAQVEAASEETEEAQQLTALPVLLILAAAEVVLVIIMEAKLAKTVALGL